MSEPLLGYPFAPQPPPSPLQQAIAEVGKTLVVLGPLTGALQSATPALQVHLLEEAQAVLLKAAAQMAEARHVVERVQAAQP